MVIDETMILWTGICSGKLQYIIRKPTPLGILLKSVCDATTGIMLHAELVEGKGVDDLKPWFKEYGATTATTLRVS